MENGRKILKKIDAPKEVLEDLEKARKTNVTAYKYNKNKSILKKIKESITKNKGE